MLKEIEDERMKLQEERARNEIAKALQSKNADDSGRSRIEIDAAVKYAEVNNFHISSNFISCDFTDAQTYTFVNGSLKPNILTFL